MGHFSPDAKWLAAGGPGRVGSIRQLEQYALAEFIADGSFEETLKAVRQAKASIAFNSMRAKAAERGYMSEEEIEAEIMAARRGE